MWRRLLHGPAVLCGHVASLLLLLLLLHVLGRLLLCSLLVQCRRLACTHERCGTLRQLLLVQHAHLLRLRGHVCRLHPLHGWRGAYTSGMQWLRHNSRTLTWLRGTLCWRLLQCWRPWRLLGLLDGHRDGPLRRHLRLHKSALLRVYGWRLR